ncbi:DUF680 domain-containing protein [Mesorhizobium sp. M7D.F.Ca.US.005.01.1.1]|uniref:DUF680 domain-containing protein n=1 Tax=Mesorhizobium sp. M7D.F.Ca.US.005.01.1.1 TaxID=2493678 RepID=UPI000F758F59|nr:DUF680 domain-containing protein [Mesorhizobium sp. M7D.F.Ca.US.005.01.1.1]AZO40815.1 DUF680 domain-containing protein [Mesorhizobium sp. M7D.F.Ca.US.005.01.1.1]
MKKIVLTAAALLIAAGTAYAGNDNVGSYDINKLATANVDSAHTSSINSIKKSEPTAQTPAQGSGRNLFGNN